MYKIKLNYKNLYTIIYKFQPSKDKYVYLPYYTYFIQKSIFYNISKIYYFIQNTKIYKYCFNIK